MATRLVLAQLLGVRVLPPEHCERASVPAGARSAFGPPAPRLGE